MEYTQIRSIISIVLRLIARIEVHGLENIPASGGCILASNHLGSLDPPLVASYVPRNDIRPMVAKKHHKNPFFRWLFNSVGGVWIDRTRADFGALRQARQLLRDGYLLGMAPEGTRSPTGALIRGKHGVAFLAASANVPVLPIAITGTENGFKPLQRLRRLRLTLRFGEAFSLPPLDPHDRDRSLQDNTDEIMYQIAALLPPPYRGVYADHPRLQELLQEEKHALTDIA